MIKALIYITNEEFAGWITAVTGKVENKLPVKQNKATLKQENDLKKLPKDIQHKCATQR